jgi:hypothetical protein
LEISKLSSDFPTPELSHNFGNLQTFPMEADYKETSSDTMTSLDNVDITKLFAALSSQITVQTGNLQDQIMRNDSRISAAFQMVVQANEDFKS